MDLGKSRAVTEYKMRCMDGQVNIDQVVRERDLGVVLDACLKFREDIRARINKAIRSIIAMVLFTLEYTKKGP